MTLRAVSLISLASYLGFAPGPGVAEPAFPLNAGRIVFLGDSITHDGYYIAVIEARLRRLDPQHLPELINLGLPSETCSGLSEPDHPFPRPDVHERLDRVLSKTKPDVVVACYGMNDGIYYPFDPGRFAAYQRGINRLIEKVHAAGAKLILMTPPAFDPLPMRETGKLRPAGAEKYAWFAVYQHYDRDVLQPYADWILQQRNRVEMVIDLHTPVNDALAAGRRADPSFAMSADGVHLNHQGHRVLARAILSAWGVQDASELDPNLLRRVDERLTLLHDAWLSYVGHKRPGVKPGLPLDEARTKAAVIERQIRRLRQAPATGTASPRANRLGTPERSPAHGR